MPGYNRTGPAGDGPMTGRGRGVCNTDLDYGRPFPDVPLGLMRGMGFGRGAGFGRRIRNQMTAGRGKARRFFERQFIYDTPADELNALKAEAESVKKYLETIQTRVTALEKTT